MFNPIDMFQAQGGAGMQAMARQFGLSPEQTARALEALMPALTMGIQRGAGLDPMGFARMFGVPDTARAAAPQGLDALGQMFGSPPLMQAVLQQASNASGVGSQVLRQMLPMMAGAVVASIVHVMLNPPAAAPERKAAAAPDPFPFAPIWTDMARAFMPAPAPPPAAPKPTRAPLGRPAAPTPSRTAAPEAKPAEAEPDVFQQMMRTGAEVQGQNIKAMQELFETFWPTAPKGESGKGDVGRGEGERAGSASAAPQAAPSAAAEAAGAPAPAVGRPSARSTPKLRRGRQSED